MMAQWTAQLDNHNQSTSRKIEELEHCHTAIHCMLAQWTAQPDDHNQSKTRKIEELEHCHTAIH